jgi:hypothetical protein
MAPRMHGEPTERRSGPVSRPGEARPIPDGSRSAGVADLSGPSAQLFVIEAKCASNQHQQEKQQSTISRAMRVKSSLGPFLFLSRIRGAVMNHKEANKAKD